MAQVTCNHDWHCHASREDYCFKFEDYICFSCGATTFDVLDKRVLLPTLEEMLGRALYIALPVIIGACHSNQDRNLQLVDALFPYGRAGHSILSGQLDSSRNE